MRGLWGAPTCVHGTPEKPSLHPVLTACRPSPRSAHQDRAPAPPGLPALPAPSLQRAQHHWPFPHVPSLLSSPELHQGVWKGGDIRFLPLAMLVCRSKQPSGVGEAGPAGQPHSPRPAGAPDHHAAGGGPLWEEHGFWVLRLWERKRVQTNQGRDRSQEPSRSRVRSQCTCGSASWCPETGTLKACPQTCSWLLSRCFCCEDLQPHFTQAAM